MSSTNNQLPDPRFIVYELEARLAQAEAETAKLRHEAVISEQLIQRQRAIIEDLQAGAVQE